MQNSVRYHWSASLETMRVSRLFLSYLCELSTLISPVHQREITLIFTFDMVICIDFQKLINVIRCYVEYILV